LSRHLSRTLQAEQEIYAREEKNRRLGGSIGDW
jgi:hypothetical protein